DRGRNRLRALDLADARPQLVAERPGQLDLAELAGLQESNRLAQGAAAAALRAGLADLVVLLGRLDDAPPFADVVTDRLFDIDVLAGLHAPDGDQGEPVVGRGGGDDVDRLIVHDAAQVMFIPGSLALLVFDVFDRPADHGLVAVANGRDDAAVLVRKLMHMLHAAA